MPFTARRETSSKRRAPQISSTGGAPPVFASRAEAGRLLGKALLGLALPAPLERPLVLAVGEGAERVAQGVADRLGGKAHLCRLEHLVLPWPPHIPFGAITIDNHHYIDPDVAGDHGLGAREMGQIAREVLAALRRASGRDRLPTVEGASVVLVSEGLNTGYRTLAAAASVRAGGAAQVIVASPCAARDALARVEKQVTTLVLAVSDAPRFYAPECYRAES